MLDTATPVGTSSKRPVTATVPQSKAEKFLNPQTKEEAWWRIVADRVVSSTTVVQIMNLRIKPSDPMRKLIGAFREEQILDTQSKLHTFATAVRSLASVVLTGDPAYKEIGICVGQTATIQEDDARAYRFYDVRRLKEITIFTTSDKVFTFRRINSRGEWIREEWHRA